MGIIKEIKIEGFKSILKEEISFGQLNVFIGSNGSGKSNLLEAIAMISSSIEGGIDYDRLARRGARLSSHEIFRSAFKNNLRKDIFKLEITTDKINYKMNINSVSGFKYNSESLTSHSGENLASRSNRGAKLLNKSLSSKIDNSKSILNLYQTLDNKEATFPTKLAEYAIYSLSTPILRGVSADNSNKAPLGLYGGRLAEAFNEVLNDKNKRKDLQRFFKLLDWYKSVSTTNSIKQELISEYVSFGRRIVSYHDSFMSLKFNELYAYDVSEGALYILFVLVLLIHNESPDIFALDNVDNALNPGLVKNLMNNIIDIISKNENKQIFLTTHNPTTLDAIDLFNEKHRLFVVERAEDGQSKFKRIKPPEGMTKEEWIDKYYGMKLSEIWLSGAIGGLPKGF